MERRTRTAIISPCHPLRGGIAEFTNNLAKHLNNREEVTVFSYSLLYPKLLFPGKTQYETEVRPMEFPYMPVINSINPLNWWRVARKINREYDKVILVYWTIFLSPALWVMAKIIRLPKIGLFHNFTDHGKKLRPVFLLRPMDRFICLSDEVGVKIRENTCKPVDVCRHPIYDYGEMVPKQEARAALGLKQDDRVVLFFGLIKEYKGLDLLIRAVAGCPGVTLIVAGEFYDNPASYYELVRECRVSDRVIIHNQFIPHHEVKNYFCAADLVVLPYRSASQSGVIQIAYSFARPLLVTSVGGLPEFVIHDGTGYVAEPTADSIRFFIGKYFEENREEIFSLNQQGVKELYSWDKIVECIAD